MVAVKKKSQFYRYLIRNCTCRKIGFAFALIALELLVVVTYVRHEESVELKEGLKSISYSLRVQHNKLLRIARQRNFIISGDSVHGGEWLKGPSRGLVKDRQPSGDFVHYTDDKRLCGRETSTLLILVMSRFEQIDERQTVRQTWGSVKHLDTSPGRRDLKWRSIFVIANHPPTFSRGGEIEIELATKNDTLRVDLMEHKVFLNMKYYGALTWALNSCRFKYVLTVEMASFVNVPVMYRLIHSPRFIGRKGIYAGDRRTKLINLPDNNEKYTKTNLTYAANGAILMSRDLVRKIVPLLKLHNRMKYDSYELMVGNVVAVLKIGCGHISTFLMSTAHCTYDESYAVVKVTSTNNIQRCFRIFFKEYYGLIVG